MYGNLLWSDLDRALFAPRRRRAASPQQMFRTLERLLEHGAGDETLGGGRDRFGTTRLNLRDLGDTLELVVALPGVRQEDVEATLEKDVLTVRARRRVELPEGHQPHRQERASWQFQRSISLPVTVDSEATRARLKDGILRVTLPKSPDSRPRQIAVTTDSN